MKKLSDNTQVPSRLYYYILDYVDSKDINFLIDTFNKDRVYSLSKDEFIRLVKHSMEEDISFIDKYKEEHYKYNDIDTH